MIQVYERGTYVGGGYTNASGVYVLPLDAPGSYFVRTGNNAGYLDQLAQGIPCVRATCTVTNGTPIVATVDQPAVVDFALVPGGTIAGRAWLAGVGPELGGIHLLPIGI